MDSYIDLISQAIVSCIDWFDEFFSRLNAFSLFMTFFVMLLAVKFIILPIIGHSSLGSDFVRRRKDRED